ncbi:ROK family protein [Streptomyces chiangmaiensis]|uniref:ROK family protein n=1 Tax=Streptomyces chiangmaiensis TaxID=766497 RepID=A0ABU7FUH6_9ACTN|nr:ROK family protein [Streptomyces chiangmaiensis]MED7827714.1 ROK family protein [Streptomyces chiangmaiensis]
MNPTLVAGIDIGGTKIAAGITDMAGDVLFGARRPTPAGDDAAAVMGALAEVIGELAARPEWAAVRAVGIGSAGPLDGSRGTVSPINIPAWRDFPLVDEVRALVGGRPVGLVGDGAAMASGEHWRGAAAGARDAVCLVVSTGVGGGLILGGSLCAGPTGNAGHLGHIIAEPDGEPCACGARGCVETAAGGPAILAWALRHGWRPDGPGAATTQAVAEAAHAGDPVALAAFDRAARAVAVAVGAVANLTEARLAVIGGGVARAGDVLFRPLRSHIDMVTRLSFARGVTVVPAALGERAGVIGAAALARDL